MGKLWNKRGSEMVEASIVMPLVILTILSTIFLLLYFYQCLNDQVSCHQKLVEMSIQGKQTFAVKKRGTSTSKKMQGITGVTMHHSYHSRTYVINIAKGIRLGEMFHDR